MNNPHCGGTLMSTRLIVPPVALAVSMDAARRSARVDVDADGTSSLDDDIAREVRAYTADAEHMTGRAFINQTWRVTLDSFPDAIKLPKSPVVSVQYVKFYDADGVQQTLDPQDYQVDAESEPGYIVPALGKAWPAAAARINAIEVQCICGYGPTDDSVPDAVKSYVLARVQQYFAPVSTANAANFERLLDQLCVYS
jgi:uncharacterized phiE125 gp8 family phage protein